MGQERHCAGCGWGVIDEEPEGLLCNQCKDRIPSGEYLFTVSLREGNELQFTAKNAAEAWAKLKAFIEQLKVLNAVFLIDEHGFLNPGEMYDYGVYTPYQCPIDDTCRFCHFENFGDIIGMCDSHREPVLDFCDKNCKPCQHRLECLTIKENMNEVAV